jgi:hypothetical protein
MDGGEGHFAARLRRNSQSGFAPVFETKKEKQEKITFIFLLFTDISYFCIILTNKTYQ